jgi:uncharacterized membrane protein
MDPSTPLAQMPSAGGGSDFFLHFGVISAIAVAMIFWAFLIELPSVVILAVSAAAMALSAWMTPPMSDAATLFPIWKLLLFVPSHTNAVNVLYPFVPWLAPAGFGIVLGRIIYKKPGSVATVGTTLGAVLIAAHLAVAATVFGAFMKYPPTASFLTITLGVDLLLLAVFALMPKARLGALEVFGRSPLFFYLLHLYVFAAIGLAFPSGSSLLVVYAVWAVAVVAMYPLVAAYGRFKASKPIESIWRLF